MSELTDGLTRDLTIDLTDVDLLPSSAVGVIANAQDTAGGRTRRCASSPLRARSRHGC